MSDFQQRFSSASKQAYDETAGLVARYKEDTVPVIDAMFGEISQLQNVKVHLHDLQTPNGLKTFMEGVRCRFNSSLKTHTHQFAEDVAQTYVSYDKKLKNILSQEGVGAKELYHHIDHNSDSDYALLKSKADNVELDITMLHELQSDILSKTSKIMSGAKRKKLFLGIVLPFILTLLVFMGASFAVYSATKAIKDAVAEITDAPDFSEASISEIFEYVQKNAELFDAVANIYIGIFEIAAASAVWGLALCLFAGAGWLVYYLVVSSLIKKKAARRLGKAMIDVTAAFAERKHEVCEMYGLYLSGRLNEMNAAFFGKYKPLIEIAQKGEQQHG